MWRSFLAGVCVTVAIVSALWLVGYGRAVQSFLTDGIRDRDWSFLTYPNIKWYREFDGRTGRLSEMKIDWFSVVDGPTGEVVAFRYYPCWKVSLDAGIVLLVSVVGAVSIWSRPNRSRL
jgi:hypothetical protein